MTGLRSELVTPTQGHNIWDVAAVSEMDLSYVHIRGANNQVADVLSRWQGRPDQ